MISLGLLTVHPHQELGYATSIAQYAASFNITFYRFTPFQINPKSQQVEGYKYDCETKEWIGDTFSLPMFIYDRCFYKQDALSKKAKPIVQWLKQQQEITFLGHGLPNKWEVYNVLKKNSSLSPYIPLTVKIAEDEQIVELLRIHESIMLKPIAGSQGKGIVKISKTNQWIESSFHTGLAIERKIFATLTDVYSWLPALTANTTYLAQPHISLYPFENAPFDIRILLQKEQLGEWKEMGRGIRKGKEDAIVTNISHGASIRSFEEVVPCLPKQHRDFIMSEIDSLSRIVPFVLEEAFPSLFELGIDICISKDCSIWLLDVNSKPGRKTVVETSSNSEEEMYKNVVAYCAYLATSSSYHRKE
ncbi:YheC/YheD family protein [Priestia megaterium]|nr:YheC/YheD family protein [Priestia megaterium]